jgi:general secretion pathway protein G
MTFRNHHLKPSKTIGHKGFTLIELMIVIAIIGTLAAIALPNYLNSRERAKITKAIADIRVFESAAYAYMVDHNRFPDTLIEAGLGNPVDPWGNMYVYYPIDNVPKGVKVRKDKSLHPVNTDFDLYSLGADGKSVAPFTAKASQDDIVRANNGAFIGLVENY